MRNTWLLASIWLLGSGCAGLVGTGQNSTVLNSEPSEAVVSLNGTVVGTTPFTYTYNPADGKDLEFEVKKEGYLPKSIELHPKQNNTVLFMDAMLLQIPYIVDGRNPKLYRMNAPEYNVQLYKELPDDLEKRMVPLVEADVKQNRKDISATFNKKPMAKDDRVLKDLEDEQQLSYTISSGLKDTWMDARYVRKGTTNGDEAIRRAKVYLKPRINMVSATLSGSRTKCSGPVELDMSWDFISGVRKDSVLFTKTTRTTYNAVNENSLYILDEALRQASRLMAEDLTLGDRIKENSTNSILAGRGEVLTIKAPKPIPFEGRKDMISALVKGVVTISTGDGHGSGFLISNDGFIVTNEHVIGDESQPKVKFEQGFTLDAEIVKVNKDIDLALLKVSATDLPALRMGDDGGLMLGEELFAIGTPLDANLGQSVSRGVLSGKREIEGRTYLQTDVTINPGNSGGPFLDETGAVVGVATMKISGKGLEGLGFGVPISVVLDMLNITITP